MKKTILLLIVFICGNNLFAQNPLTKTEKLTATAKVWGFLKYYHPEVADGKYNWDEELFKVLPRIKDCKNKGQLSQVYLDWINSLGQIKLCKKCNQNKKHEYFDKNFDLDWLSNDQIFTPELSKKLRYIEVNRHQGEKYYVSTSKKIGKGKIVITNEKEYKNFDWNSEDLRLLTLFRYWNIVEYFFPYKYQTDTHWDEVLNRMIPRFLSPNSETDFHNAMLELAVSLDDSHVRLNTHKTRLFYGPYNAPAIFKIIDGKAIVTDFNNDSLARLNDLRIGDVITKVNGKKIETLFQDKEKYISGSNISRKIFYSSYYIFNGPTNSLKIEVTREGETTTKFVKRYLYKDFGRKPKDGKKTNGYKILEGNVGYIDLSTLGNTDVPDVMEALKDTKAIIFDVRNAYAVEQMYYFGHYITSPRKDFYKVILPDLDYPGKFFWDEGTDVGYNKELRYGGKVVLLVDEGCQSQCEYTVMCLQTANNATTVGTQTSGADGNVSRFNMVGGYETQISGVGVFYPDGTEAQRKGVKIDIKVKPTIQGLINGKDEILEKAIEFVKQ